MVATVGFYLFDDPRVVSPDACHSSALYKVEQPFTFYLSAGLLAGLHEFPTCANVSGTSLSASGQTKVLHSLLSEFLRFSYAHAGPVSSKSTATAESSSSGVWISQIRSAGDVVHVFSHIRKTYRVQWVLLEGGGDEPPQLAPSVRRPINALAKSKPKAKGKMKAKIDIAESSEADEPTHVTAKWMPFEKVEDAKYVVIFTNRSCNIDCIHILCSIGTGVLKVWNLAKVLWEGNS